eukprot:gnl/TRDRNA2_/TRDRNA2_91954_c0_seq1.p1 gnl/TRDRNA2_/TRDRNA2_91954_c0~~gnl/TRDRNA2_/TRDRNA2_91954_c0_seq1.p1  ORF type:complete len:379 (+),score=32.05 gnl/TRDRNA2_/TRDRNA2_91954_c0_seq1:65-1201(+)
MQQSVWRKSLRHVLASFLLALFCASPRVLTLYLGYDESERELISEIKWTDHMTTVVANYIGDASFAMSGSLMAGMEGMDYLGCIIVGFITALGGGTFRDVMLGRLPIWWLTALDEPILCIAVASMTFFLWPRLSNRFHLTATDEWLFWTDTLGLGVFAAAGAHSGSCLEPRLHILGCAMCGMFSATFGGLTRDVLIARPPRILYSLTEVYALPAFLGALATSAVLRMISDTWVMESITLGTWVTVHLRVLAVNHDLKLPHFPSSQVYSKEARPRDAAFEVMRGEDEQRETVAIQSFIGNGFFEEPLCPAEPDHPINQRAVYRRLSHDWSYSSLASPRSPGPCSPGVAGPCSPGVAGSSSPSLGPASPYYEFAPTVRGA